MSTIKVYRVDKRPVKRYSAIAPPLFMPASAFSIISLNPGPMVRPLHLAPLEWLDWVAALIPPRRRHRHRYHGVAPNAPRYVMR